MLVELTPAEVEEKFENKEIVLIDVRTPIEFAFERIRGALNAPMATLDPDALPAQDVKPIVFYCGSGKRSEVIARKCLEAGYKQAMHMKGGLAAWKLEGNDTIAVNPVTGNMPA